MPGRLLSFTRRNSSSSASTSSSEQDAAPRVATGGVPPSSKDALRALRQSSAAAKKNTGTMDHLRKHSLAGLTGHGKDKNKDGEKKKGSMSPSMSATGGKLGRSLNKLDLAFESPPAMFYGNMQNSSGALVSGQLRLHLEQPKVASQPASKTEADDFFLESMTMELVASFHAQKPVSKDCPDCAVKINVLNKWTFIKDPKKLKAGEHQFPFSYLLQGHLPASTKGQLAELHYYLRATATVRPAKRPASSPLPSPAVEKTIALGKPLIPTPQPPSQASASSAAKTIKQQSSPLAQASMTPDSIHKLAAPLETLQFRQPLPVYRSLQPATDKNSLRIFPPTNITANVTMKPVIHPIGDFPVLMRLNGLTEKLKDMQVRWRLRKLSWRLEEREKMVSPACSRHAHKVGGEGKGIGHEETRDIGYDDLKEGWKTNLDDGEVEIEFKCHPRGNVRPLCDVESPNGLSISHALVIEMVVAEEWAPTKRSNQATPTGAARVLRMQFALVVTERGGLGISWDEEQPPTYEDVPASPPMYPAGTSKTPSHPAPAYTYAYPPGPLTDPAYVDSPIMRHADDPRTEVHDYTGPPLDEPPSLSRPQPPPSSSASTIPLDHELEGLSLGAPSDTARSLLMSSTGGASRPSTHAHVQAQPPPPPPASAARRRLDFDLTDFEVDAERERTRLEREEREEEERARLERDGGADLQSGEVQQQEQQRQQRQQPEQGQ